MWGDFQEATKVGKVGMADPVKGSGCRRVRGSLGPVFPSGPSWVVTEARRAGREEAWLEVREYRWYGWSVVCRKGRPLRRQQIGGCQVCVCFRTVLAAEWRRDRIALVPAGVLDPW